MLQTSEETSVKILMTSPLDIIHIRIVESPDPEAKYSPFGENTTLYM